MGSGYGVGWKFGSPIVEGLGVAGEAADGGRTRGGGWMGGLFLLLLLLLLDGPGEERGGEAALAGCVLEKNW